MKTILIIPFLLASVSASADSCRLYFQDYDSLPACANKALKAKGYRLDADTGQYYGELSGAGVPKNWSFEILFNGQYYEGYGNTICKALTHAIASIPKCPVKK
jgi:hypothetical protein